MSYQVNAYVIGVRGRTVRCVRCRKEWFAPPPGDTAALAMSWSTPVGASAPVEAPAGDESAFRSELGGDLRSDEAGAPGAPPVVEQPLPGLDEEPIDEPPHDDAPPQPPPSDPREAGGATLEDAGAAAIAAPAGPDAADESVQPPAAPEQHPPAALSSITIPVEEAPPLVPEPQPEPAALDSDSADIESVAARRRAQQAARRRRKKTRSRLPALILVLVAVVATLLAWRKDIVRRAPQMASLYATIGLPVNLRGLVFQDVSVSHETHDGVPVLVVAGKIASTASMPVDVPRLRFALRNAAGVEIYAWTAVPAQSVLKPGETLAFRGRLASPPGDGQDVQVRFFTRRDAAGDIK